METGILAGRIRDLSNRAYQNDYLTHTAFLSASEQAEFYDCLKRMGVSALSKSIDGVHYCLYGGHPDAERCCAFFLPSYMDEDQLIQTEALTGEYISCIRVRPANPKFAEALDHRDYLGALMNMGITREQIGDILKNEEEAYIYAAADMASLIAEELTRVKHTSVVCEIIPPAESRAEQAYRELSGSVASERLDAILAMVYRLSRTRAQELIRSEKVYLNGRITTDSGQSLKPGDRVSVRGFGKFLFDGTGARTKKDRVYANVRLFA